MIIAPRRRCDDCTNLGVWGRGTTATTRRCEQHKRDDDQNLIEGKCATCGIDENLLNKSGICTYCGEAPKVKRQYLVKQKFVKAALEEEFKFETYDAVIDGGICSRKRPDFVIDFLYGKIVVEVDEHQHVRGYGPECEYNRMWEIAQALGTATVFIRFNPDAYTDASGHRVDTAIGDRCGQLITWIRTLRMRPLDSFASTLYLYYDGFDRSETAQVTPLSDPFERFALSDDDITQLLADIL